MSERAMLAEIQDGMDFLANYLSSDAADGKIPRRKVVMFTEQLANLLLDRIASANHYRMPLVIPPAVILTVIAVALVAFPLSAWPAWRVARAQNPARALRELARE
jgi:ABC-type lipoprotein release transport system permease subunit